MEPDVTYYLIVNGDEENAQERNSGYQYFFTPDITDYTLVLKAVKTYEDGKVVKSVRSNLLQYNTSEDTSDGTYLSNPANILGTVSHDRQVKIFWEYPEELTDQKELGEIDAFRIVVDGKELEGVSIEPDFTMSYTLAFDNILDKKNVQIRAYKTVNGKPFIASTSDVWVATPNCNVLDDENTFETLTGENPPYNDNGDLTVDVSNKDTTGSGEVSNTGVTIQIPIEVNVSNAKVEFIDQYDNTIASTTISETADGKQVAEFSADMSENELSDLIFDIVISKDAHTKYTLKGVPYSRFSDVNIQNIKLNAGDLNKDGKINAMDMLALGVNLGQSGSDVTAFLGDLNGDGKINAMDMLALSVNLGSASEEVIWNQ